MSRSMHRQRPKGFGWQPPEMKSKASAPFDAPPTVQSATECTGLMTQPAMNEAESESLSRLYGIHAMKPQGNPGKGNPKNDPDEIAFHREHTK